MIPLPPHSLPGLESIFDGTAWSRWVDEGRTFPLADLMQSIRYVRLKPDDSCRLFVFGPRAENPSAAPFGFYLQLFATVDRAREAFAKEQTRHHRAIDQLEPFLCEQTATVAVPFPNDAELPDLRHVYEPDRFRRTLGDLLSQYPTDDWRIKRRKLSSEVLSYKPGRRCVFKTTVELRNRHHEERKSLVLHVQVEPSHRAEETYKKQSVLSTALTAAGSATRESYGWVRSRGVIATEWVDGVTLSSHLATTESDVLAAVGQELATLHSLTVELPHCPSPIERADTVLRLTADVCKLLPDAAPEIQSLSDSLTESLKSFSLLQSSIVHGDFHPGQVLVRDRRPLFIDFDRAGRGYAVEDIGNFIAYLLEAQAPLALCEQFLVGYRSQSTAPNDELLRSATALALFHRLPAPFRRLDPQWPDQTRRLITLAQETLRGDIL